MNKQLLAGVRFLGFHRVFSVLLTMAEKAADKDQGQCALVTLVIFWDLIL